MPSPWPAGEPTAAERAAYAGAEVTLSRAWPPEQPFPESPPGPTADEHLAWLRDRLPRNPTGKVLKRELS